MCVSSEVIYARLEHVHNGSIRKVNESMNNLDQMAHVYLSIWNTTNESSIEWSVNVNHLQHNLLLCVFSSVVLQHYRNVILETIAAEDKIGLQYAVQTTTVSD